MLLCRTDLIGLILVPNAVLETNEKTRERLQARK